MWLAPYLVLRQKSIGATLDTVQACETITIVPTKLYRISD